MSWPRSLMSFSLQDSVRDGTIGSRSRAGAAHHAAARQHLMQR
jgi:hypothetical protein